MGAAVAAVDPAELVREAFDDSDVRDFIGGAEVTVVAAGKAAEGMIGGLLTSVDMRIRRGVAVGPASDMSPPKSFRWHTGGHPIPNHASVEGAREALRMTKEMPADGCLVVLLSGGASALMASPVSPLTLDDKICTTEVLLASGVPIHELNCVRKHLSSVKGGALAQASMGRVLTLAISDVVAPVEDDPSVIGSGPTVPDETTFADALDIVQRPGIRRRIPSRVLDVLERGRREEMSETLRREDRDAAAMYRIIGSRRHAMKGAVAAARRLGYSAMHLDEPVVGEAREVGREHLARVKDAWEGTGPACVVSSGETTVTVQGCGRGGRNQELALAALEPVRRAGPGVVLASVGTDGVDGPTDAAGAVVAVDSVDRARRLGLAPEAYLENNDAYTFFDELGDLVRTGPTGTNVGDVQVVLTT